MTSVTRTVGGTFASLRRLLMFFNLNGFVATLAHMQTCFAPGLSLTTMRVTSFCDGATLSRLLKDIIAFLLLEAMLRIRWINIFKILMTYSDAPRNN